MSTSVNSCPRVLAPPSASRVFVLYGAQKTCLCFADITHPTCSFAFMVLLCVNIVLSFLVTLFSHDERVQRKASKHRVGHGRRGDARSGCRVVMGGEPKNSPVSVVSWLSKSEDAD